MQRTAVLNIVGLTTGLLGPNTPHINAFLKGGGDITAINPVFPAVTCSAQSTYLTGLRPSEHGIVGNGWYNRELAEVQFWKQSNHLVHGRKVWEELRASVPNFTCAKLFWWYNMYSSADYSITPRPMYPADGRKIFDIYTWPFSIRTEIKKDLGEFPFPTFWGPAAGVKTPQGGSDAASRWIAESAKWIENRHAPSLSLVYLPHLDYNLQRFGPNDPRIAEDVRAIDAIAGDLIAFFSKRGVSVIILSEYGITEVSRPVDINRFFRANHWLTVKDELGLEVLDCGASKAFAVADHQIAHIYINDRSLEKEVRKRLADFIGGNNVLDKDGKRAAGIDHPRAGDLVAIAPEGMWFTYYYWANDRVAPDFARCVDIHRKPGYDPAELFIDSKLKAPKLKIGWRLLKKKLGFRMLMDVIPLDASLVRGSHGTVLENAGPRPVFIAQRGTVPAGAMDATDVYHAIKRAVRG
ncbi:MAG: alkaline phosphatase family protein [Verrucomicrobia subdivision 3 bacterium]|nr:alkaline phosphatase family protein [Limisphaerales bacterium]